MELSDAAKIVAEIQEPDENGFVPGCRFCDTLKNGDGWGPSHFGSSGCRSGSLASGGRNAHCTCDGCF